MTFCKEIRRDDLRDSIMVDIDDFKVNVTAVSEFVLDPAVWCFEVVSVLWLQPDKLALGLLEGHGGFGSLAREDVQQTVLVDVIRDGLVVKETACLADVDQIGNRAVRAIRSVPETAVALSRRDCL